MAITSVNSFFTSPFGLFGLITDPKVVVVTAETISSKEKIKLRRSMFILDNNNKTTEHSLPMTRSSPSLPKVVSTTISVYVGNKLMIVKQAVLI